MRGRADDCRVAATIWRKRSIDPSSEPLSRPTFSRKGRRVRGARAYTDPAGLARSASDGFSHDAGVPVTAALTTRSLSPQSMTIALYDSEARLSAEAMKRVPT